MKGKLFTEQDIINRLDEIARFIVDYIVVNDVPPLTAQTAATDNSDLTDILHQKGFIKTSHYAVLTKQLDDKYRLRFLDAQRTEEDIMHETLNMQISVQDDRIIYTLPTGNLVLEDLSPLDIRVIMRMVRPREIYLNPTLENHMRTLYGKRQEPDRQAFSHN
jgi:hypothetical protein